MNKLFVDTNAFFKIGYNFDEKNPIISSMIKNANDKEYEYYNLSVIDNEIISHIKERAENDLTKIKKYRWLRKYISDDIIEKNCYKCLEDYNNFKNKISAINCNVSNINPEIVLERYFNVEPPFEKTKGKKYEFPDAFISEFINNIEKSEKEKVFLVTDDKGLKNSINKNVIIYSDLEEFLSDINKINPMKFSKIKDYILKNIEEIQSNLRERFNYETFGLEYEVIEPDELKINNIINFEIVDFEENNYCINCTCDFITLTGEFSCLDYNNSYMPNDCDFYAVEKHIRLNEIEIKNYEFLIEIKDSDKDEYVINYFDKYDLRIDYELLEEQHYNALISSYDGETSFSQDGDFR